MVKAARPDTEKLTALFLAAVGKKPSDKKLKESLDHLGTNSKNKKAPYESHIWTLMNRLAFSFNQ